MSQTLTLSYGLPAASNDASNAFDNNGLFGPKNVHPSKALKGMLKDYDRRAGIDNETWLRQYATGPEGKVQKSVNWPNDKSNGFAVDNNGTPRISRTTIPKGTLIDRFGHATDSAFFAPFGTPFRARALPANLLYLPYNAYEVVKEFEADEGPIAPGFGQPGMGVQFVVPAKMVNGSAVKQTPEVLEPEYLRLMTTSEIEENYARLFPENLDGDH